MDSTPRAYRLKASNAAPPISTSIGTSPLISAATAFTIIFALSPTYLKYRQRRAVLLGTMLAASACQLVLLVVLVPGLGATGAAIAFGLSIGGMYGVFAVIAWRDLKSAKEGA